jgi:hypothetical protein
MTQVAEQASGGVVANHAAGLNSHTACGSAVRNDRAPVLAAGPVVTSA